MAVLRSRGWSAATLAWLAAILALLPVGPDLWRGLRPFLLPSPMTWFVGAGAVLGLALAGRAVAASPRRRGVALALLAAAGTAYLALLLWFYDDPTNAERLHLLQYGVLGYLAANAVTVRSGRALPLVAGALFLAAAAGGDEAIQAILPQRYFGWKDIAGNLLGAILGVLGWIAASANSPLRRPSRPATGSPAGPRVR